MIFLNTGHDFVQYKEKETKKERSLEEQFFISLGLMGHESLHHAHTDSKKKIAQLQAIEDRKDLPYPSHYHQLGEWIKTLDKKQAKRFMIIYQEIWNCLEDAHIEIRGMREQPSSYLIEGLYVLRQSQYEGFKKEDTDDNQFFMTSDPEEEKIGKSHILVGIINVLLCYAKYGRIRTTSVKNKVVQIIWNERETIKKCVRSNSAKNRIVYTADFIYKILPYIEDYLLLAEEQQKEAEELQKMLRKMISHATSEESQTGNGRGLSMPLDDDTYEPDEIPDDADADNTEGTPKGTPKETPNAEDGEIQDEDPTFDSIKEIEEDLSEGHGDAIKNILNQAVKETAEKKREKELQQQLEEEKKFSGFRNTIVKRADISGQMVQEYRSCGQELEALAKVAAKMVKVILTDRENGGWMKDQWSGTRISMRKVIRNKMIDTGKVMERKILPEDKPRIAVAVRVDESGSMWGNKTARARATSIILYNFCKELNIPISIYGDTADDNEGYGTVTIRSYAEYDSLDNQDKYRLMNISARSNNRDGAGIRFVAEKLALRDETKKILFIITDGVPAATNYYGDSANQDVVKALCEAKKKGLIPIAFAIDGDKDAMKAMYGDTYVEVQELRELPKLMCDVIKKALNIKS